MPNKNYRAGRRFEYEIMKMYEQQGFTALRTAGSHGPFDVIVYGNDCKPKFIQCKRVTKNTDATRLLDAFEKNTHWNKYFTQALVVKVKRDPIPREVTV